MKIWVNPIGLEHAKKLINIKDVDYVVTGVKGKLSARNTCLLSLDEIAKINCSKLVVSLNNLYVDDQLPLLEKTLRKLKALKVKTIIFTDFAVKQICDEINYKPNFVYNSETLTTNYDQLPFFKKHGIREVVLPRELYWNEINEFGKHKNGMKLQVQAEGFGLMMHSKWTLLTNFKKQFNVKQDLTNKMFYLKEETRSLPSLIIEDETGTHVFTGYNVSIMDYLDKMVKAKIDSINLFSYLHDEKWVDETIKIYVDALKAIKNKTFAKKKQSFINRINKINKVSACGFLDPTKGLLHLEREANNE
ncbi:MAG: U32 family peptidase [Mycoplasma sp.]|nr:U32 family peptidase [Candidatus Hennigella equi]